MSIWIFFYLLFGQKFLYIFSSFGTLPLLQLKKGYECHFYLGHFTCPKVHSLKSMLTLVSRIAAYMLLFFFGKFCTPICLIQAYASINFQKNCKNIVLKIRFYTNPYASIQNFSTLCLYDFFEIASSMLLFPTMPQYETLE